MNKKKTAITIFFSLLLIIFFSCSEINPFFAGGVVPGGNWIYFAEGSNINRMRLDGSELESVFTVGYFDIQRIQLDQMRQKIYVLDVEPAGPNSRIYEYNLDGTGEKKLSEHLMTYVMDMKIDSMAGELYYVFDDGVDYRLWKINLSDGTAENFYYNPSLGNVSLSPDYSGYIYLAFNAGMAKINIESNAFSSVPVSPVLGVPMGLTLNRGTNDFYLYDGQIIKRISGSASTDIYDSFSMNYARNMEISSVDQKLFYYHDNPASFEHDLYSINLDGTGLDKIYTGGAPLGGFDILSK